MSKSRTPRKMIHVDCDPIRKLLGMSRSIRLMTDHVRNLVASPENQHIQCVTPSKSGVVVWTDSGAWASRLRFAIPALAGRLPRVEGFDSVAQVSVKVLPASDMPAQKKRRAEISMESAEMLWSSAAHIGDERLSAALRRLASHARADRDPKGS